MSKGTSSFGKHNKIIHIRCRRCGRHTYHVRHSSCAACGYPRAKMRNESWRWKPVNKAYRKTILSKHQKQKTARQGRWKKTR